MGLQRLKSICGVGVVASLLLSNLSSVSLAQDRVLGLDISAWQGNISQTTWNNLYQLENREFVFLRSSRGGTTGFYNQSDPNNNNNLNTLSQRYDDPYFVQNMRRATNAGLLAGAYHFSRPDIVSTTQNSGGIANSGTDEADHFIQMAGAWMRPGYLLPVHDLEAGDGFRSNNEMAQFALDFSNRIHEVMGFRPAIYINGNYANFVIGAASGSLQDAVVETHPVLWSARWPNQSNPDSIPVQTGHPKDSYSPIYGPWDDPPNPTHPWSFWQYASTGRLNSFNNGNSNLDFNVAQGTIEFVKDRLVPALWLSHDGDWSNLDNWNSGQPPVIPVQGPGQVLRVGPLTLPDPRLPGLDDTVILRHPSTSFLVTHSSGEHSIRKLEVDESLDVTGGILNVEYVPTADSTPWSTRIGGQLAVNGTGAFGSHTIQVEAGGRLTVDQQITFASLSLAPAANSLAAGRLEIVEQAHFVPWDSTTASISQLDGAGGRIEMTGGNTNWIVADGSQHIDLSVDVPIDGDSIFKLGNGTLELLDSTGYSGHMIVREGDISLSSPLIADDRSVFLSVGAEMELNFSGVDTVDALYIEGIGLSPGTWGAPGSGAQFALAVFRGPGIIHVTNYSPILPGDFNQDGVVDAADFTVWRDNLTATGMDPYTRGDATGDGVVDLNDWDVWQSNFGMTVDSLAAMVPEPDMAPQLYILACVLVAARRRSATYQLP